MRLALIHQSPNSAPPPADAVLWRTCLREILFVDDARPFPARGVVADGEAYALLVEIVSGLRSPLIGETEVQAQFKTFLASLDPRMSGPLLRVGQRVLADAKLIRQRHLQGFGAHSYGRLVRRHLPSGTRIVVIGTGALATEIIAKLDASPLKDGEAVRRVSDQWGRHAERAGQGLPTLPHAVPCFHLLSSAVDRPVTSTDPTTLVIAAPASLADLSAVSACYPNLAAIIDLRPADERTLFAATAVPVVTLDDLFDEARETGAAATARVDAARRDIVTLSREYDQREELHPFGWDDVCA